MSDINCRYQIDNDSNRMLLANDIQEEREKCRVHYLPGVHPLEVDKGMVEQARFIGTHIVLKAKLIQVAACLLKWASMFTVHHCGHGGAYWTD